MYIHPKQIAKPVIIKVVEVPNIKSNSKNKSGISVPS
jgi:hypothetical protein